MVDVVLGAMYRNAPTSADLNTIKTPGAYPIRNSANKPVGNWGYLVVNDLGTDTNTSCVVQYFVTNETSATYSEAIWQRKFIRNSSGEGWASWQRIDNYGTSSLAELASALKAIW